MIESVTFLENSMTYGESLPDTAAEALPTLGRGEPAEGGVNTRPVLGGETSVTLTAAPTLASLGVSVSSLGSASIDTSGGDPVARFAITGGTEGPGDGTNIFLHQDSGLKLSSRIGALELRDFRIDTENMVVSANVTVNGAAAGNVAVFDIGPDGSLTLTNAAAGVARESLGVPAITPDVVIGSAAPEGIVDLTSLQDQFASNGEMQFLTSPNTVPIIGGETTVALTAAATLQSLNVSVSPLGSAVINPGTPDPIAQFPVTGGTVGPNNGEAIILHQGSGLELSDNSSNVELRDFLIDTQNRVVDANVTVNDFSLGNVPIFTIAGNGNLLLTPTAAGALSNAFHAPVITAGLPIGPATPSPVLLSADMHG
jgi:hypothetical protein